jgi:hypothetical protein
LYSRFRPGLGLTLAFLFLFVAGMQYTFHALTANRQRAHMSRYIDEVKEVAWRPSGGNPPLSGAKKYITLQDQSRDGDRPARKFAIDFGGNVYLVDAQTGEEHLLDLGEIEGAHWKRTIIYSLPISLWVFGTGMFEKKENVAVPEEDTEEHEENGGTSTPTGMGKYEKAEKVGGRRKAKKRN